jgi:beta-lactamase regulating signal transducer with metallopeptidase domain
MIASLAEMPMSAADSARAAASVYTASLLATGPILAAIVGAVALRRASAEGRVLVWRAAAVMLLIVFAGRLLPLRLTGWSVPSFIAAPLVALGRVRVADLGAPVSRDSFTLGARWIQVAVAVYVIGIVATLIPTLAGTFRARRLLRRARRVDRDTRWASELADARSRVGARRDVSLYLADDVGVPMTWGVLRPVVVLPVAAEHWTSNERRMVLSHELAHVRASDWGFGVAARVACALFWFHPGAWWIATSLRRDAERAADDRVISSGTSRSDYAELLIAASPRIATPVASALALSGRGPLRARLCAILDLRRDVRPLSKGWALVATGACVLSIAPLGAVEVAPTRDVLATLMRDSRWESRAYAVMGLARRPDSVAVARSAAELDPNPRVRAWARYALGLRPRVSAEQTTADPN